MNNPQRPINNHQAYHAHVYFNQDSVDFASDLRQSILKEFALKVGRVNKMLVGPHTKWSFQILFNHKSFDELIPWLDEQRGDLSVLVHALTGDDLADHTIYAYWLGDSIEVDLTGL